MEVGGGFICEAPDCVTEGGSSPGPLGAGLFSMPRFEPDTQKSGPRPHQRGKTSQPLHGANYFFADLSKFFLTFADFSHFILQAPRGFSCASVLIRGRGAEKSADPHQEPRPRPGEKKGASHSRDTNVSPVCSRPSGMSSWPLLPRCAPSAAGSCTGWTP